ncbi:Zinc finger, C2H2 type [Plasmodiophora brassicae]
MNWEDDINGSRLPSLVEAAALLADGTRGRGRSAPEGKRFQCEFCQQAFTRRSNLDRHQLVHTKEKNFACPACGTLFSLAANVKRHMKLKHGVDVDHRDIVDDVL